MSEHNVNDLADQWICRLDMREIPLGGYFADGFRSDEHIPSTALPPRFEGDRDFYSTNYYLLKTGQVLGLHTLNQDELWYFNQGGPIQLHIFPPGGVYRTVTVGSDWDQGEVLQAVAPHNHWFGAELPGSTASSTASPSYSLCGCSLSPGWDSRDSAKPTEVQIEELKRTFPQQATIIDRLTGCA